MKTERKRFSSVLVATSVPDRGEGNAIMLTAEPTGLRATALGSRDPRQAPPPLGLVFFSQERRIGAKSSYLNPNKTIDPEMPVAFAKDPRVKREGLGQA